MDDTELRALIAQIEKEEEQGIVCDCYKCFLKKTLLYPGVSGKPRPKKKRGPSFKKQTDADLHAEHRE